MFVHYVDPAILVCPIFWRSCFWIDKRDLICSFGAADFSSCGSFSSFNATHSIANADMSVVSCANIFGEPRSADNTSTVFGDMCEFSCLEGYLSASGSSGSYKCEPSGNDAEIGAWNSKLTCDKGSFSFAFSSDSFHKRMKVSQHKKRHTYQSGYFWNEKQVSIYILEVANLVWQS